MAATDPAGVDDVKAHGLFVEPYCVNVTSRSAELLWIGGAAEAGSVDVMSGGRRLTFGALPTPLAAAGLVHWRASLSQLSPDTVNRYTLSHGAARVTGSFRTAPENHSKAPFRFAVLGDSQPASAPEAASAVAAAVANEAPSFVVHLGDLAQEVPPTVERLRDQFFHRSSPYLSTCAVFPIFGNHEGDGALFRQLFAIPPLPYRLAQWGNCGFALIDVGVLEEQKDQIDAVLEQLDNDLKGLRTEWLLAACHVAPGFGVGAVKNPWEELPCGQRLLTVLEKNGVDFALAGHSHIYERFLPIGPAGGKPVIHIVSGGGGGNLMCVRPSPILANGIGQSVHHYLLFEIEGRRLKMTAKPPEGTVIDSLELEKRDGVYQEDVMRSAVETSLANRLTLLYDAAPDDRMMPPQRETPFYRHRADFHGKASIDPVKGGVTGVALNVERFPKKSTVRVSPSDGCAWKMAPQAFVIDGGMIHLKATADLTADGASTGSPLILDLELTVDGRSFGPSPVLITLT